MSAPDGPLLVVAPHATRTGSTRVLIDLLTRAGGAIGVPIAIQLVTGGPRAEEIRALGRPLRPGEVPRAALANGSLAAPALEELPPEVPTAVYVHEPGEVVASLGPAAARALRRADQVLCVSEQVRGDLLDLGIDADRLSVLAPLMTPRSIPGPGAVDAARRELGVGAGQRLVLGCGEAAWRKGADLFVEVAGVLSSRPEVVFGWVGRRLRPFAQSLDHDVRGAGLDDRMVWLGDIDDPLPHLATADVLLVPSRFDPQPLVPLEAAAVGTPTAGFANGGLVELAAAGAASVVPFPDTPALAGLVARVLDHPEESAALVAGAVGWVEERQAPAVIVPAFVQVLQDLLGSVPSSPATMDPLP